jgi:selenocysteine lyase/cysteine desulfurase
VPANDPGEVVDLVKKALTPRTKVIAWPHVTSALGVVQPAKEICALARERGIFSALDGAQAIGHVAIDVKDLGCDAYFGSPHKWMLAPAGSGFLYVRKEAAPRLWTTLASGEWANEKDSGFRLQQRGTGNLPLLLGYEAALDFHRRVGPEKWRARIKELGDRLRDGLTRIPGVTVYSSTHPAMCAGITTWRIAGKTGGAMQDYFWEKGRLRPRSVGDEWGVRTSTTIYNSEGEVDRLLALARTLAG